MRRIILSSFLLGYSLISVATPQAGDILIWKGDTLTLFANPLEGKPEIEKVRKHFFNKYQRMTTACWRGYIAQWEIIEDRLFLTAIYSCFYYEDKIKADLKRLFPKEYHNGKIEAKWVTETVLVPMGECIHYSLYDYLAFYEKEMELKFEKGILKKKMIYDNSKSKKSIYAESKDSLNNFIYEHIDWQRIPDLGNKQLKIFLSFISSGTSTPDSFQIIRGTDNAILNEEALRAARLLPEWNVYYSKGKPVRVGWHFPIIFDENTRKKYNK